MNGLQHVPSRPEARAGHDRPRMRRLTATSRARPRLGPGAQAWERALEGLARPLPNGMRSPASIASGAGTARRGSSPMNHLRTNPGMVPSPSAGDDPAALRGDAAFHPGAHLHGPSRPGQPIPRSARERGVSSGKPAPTHACSDLRRRRGPAAGAGGIAPDCACWLVPGSQGRVKREAEAEGPRPRCFLEAGAEVARIGLLSMCLGMNGRMWSDAGGVLREAPANPATSGGPPRGRRRGAHACVASRSPRPPARCAAAGSTEPAASFM